MRVRRLLLLLSCCGVAGCGDLTGFAPQAVEPEITVHGVIHLTPSGVTGPQGQQPPHFLHTDDGRLLGLVLSPELAVLGEPDSEGRSVTVTGRLRPIVVEPIGPFWDGIVVSSFEFDPS